MTQSHRPLARHEQLAIRVLDNETLVYKLDIDECVCLEGDAARIWAQCDGTRSIDELAVSLVGTDPAPARQIVLIALEQLRAQGLLVEASLPEESALRGLTRREMIKRAGLVGITVPLVTTMLVPSAAAASSVPAASTTTIDANSGAVAATTTAPATTTTTTPASTTTSTSTTSTTTSTSTTTTTTTPECASVQETCVSDSDCCPELSCIDVESGPTGFVCLNLD